MLVVDDEQSMCELVENGLGQKNFSVVWRTSSAEALQQLASEDFDVVLTDLNLDEMSGNGLCDWVQKQRPDVPAVVMTGFGAVALAQFDEIRLEDLPESIREPRAREVLPTSDDADELPTMAEVEERYIRSVLEAVGHNKTQAAKVLGFDRRTLYRKLERTPADSNS